MTQLEGTACLHFSSSPCLREHMLHCASIAGPPADSVCFCMHASSVQQNASVTFQGFNLVLYFGLLFFFFLHIGVVYCYHHVCVVLWRHRNDNCLSVWIGCLWTRCRHRHEAIVVTLRFNCHTWICRWGKRFSRGSFLCVHFYNSLLFFTHQEPVMEKQMPFLCPVMGAEAVCVCVQGGVGLFRRSEPFTSAFHCIWLVCNGRQCHPGPDIRLMYGGERDRWVCPFPF